MSSFFCFNNLSITDSMSILFSSSFSFAKIVRFENRSLAVHIVDLRHVLSRLSFLKDAHMKPLIGVMLEATDMSYCALGIGIRSDRPSF